MAKYRAKAQLYVGTRLVAPGESFTSEDVPGTQWEPLDDEGHAAYEKKHAKPNTKPGAKGPVEIPEKWEDMRPEQRINLARQLGAPSSGTTVQKADIVIKAEIKKRADADKAAAIKPAVDKKDA